LPILTFAGGGVTGELMVAFGTKQAWLAIRATSPEPVVAALGARDLGPVDWRSGLDLAYLTDDRLALTPSLPGARGAGWTLVAGRWLLASWSTVDIVALSSALGTEVQAFSTYRVGEQHRWQRAVDGILVRAFAYAGTAGEVTTWYGDPDETELAVGLPPAPDEDNQPLVGEADVMRIAAAWSVDPTTLAGRPAPGPLRTLAVP
jgi:hypothetical protein